jgi:5-methylcytosine-specific restriction endonuclease McrA
MPSCGDLIDATPHRRGKCKPCQREYDRKRGKTRTRGYDAEHKRLRKLAIERSPVCVDCGATERLTADHIVPRSEGGLNVLSNYAVRCLSCNVARRNRKPAFLTTKNSDPTPALRETNASSPRKVEKTPSIG